MHDTIINRYLQMDLPKGQSAFLWGPRKTGKSTFLTRHFADSVRFDLLNTDLYLKWLNRPALMREQVIALSPDQQNLPVIIDEVQKIPALLDEVHWLIEKKRIGFILCGSSARKLRRSGVNMLGGRAWRYELFPLVYPEIAQPDLLRILNQGLLPSHYLMPETEAGKLLKGYTDDYLKEEVFQEGLTRNIPAFSRFFEILPYVNGELVNYSKIAADCGVDAKTVKSYFEILVDTLVGTFLLPFQSRAGRDTMAKTPKFYLFDVGVVSSLSHRTIGAEQGEQFGKAFEHYIFMELLAHRKYTEQDYPVRYWRTRSGLEVDFIIGTGRVVAIEVKGSAQVRSTDLKALKYFREDQNPQRAILVCNEQFLRISDNVEIMPWRHFLDQLWSGKIIS